MNGAAKACRHAATKWESEICYKYSKEILPDRSSPEIVPLVFEHFVTLGSKRKTYRMNWEERQSSLMGDK